MGNANREEVSFFGDGLLPTMFAKEGIVMGFFQKLFAKEKKGLWAPVSGDVIPLSEVNDPTFAMELVGKGVAIRPNEGLIVAPCDGTVDMVFDTGHAITLVSENGAEILIHVGLDTVNLKGEHYEVAAKSGDHVKKGDLLIRFDREAIAAAGYDTVTPVVVCNPDKFKTFNTHTGITAAAGDMVIELAE